MYLIPWAYQDYEGISLITTQASTVGALFRVSFTFCICDALLNGDSPRQAWGLTLGVYRDYKRIIGVLQGLCSMFLEKLALPKLGAFMCKP